MELLLILTPCATALGCYLSPAKLRNLINNIGSLIFLCLGLIYVQNIFANGTRSLYQGMIYVDALSSLLLLIIVLIGAMAALFSVPYMRREEIESKLQSKQLTRYFTWLHLFLATLVASCVVNNLGLLWVAIEATTLVSALLVAFYQKEASLEAGWKYILLCTVGIAFALFGLILLYFSSLNITSDINPLHWSDLMKHAALLNPDLLKLAFIFALVGFGTKAGLAPLHTWLPDAHSQAPAPVSALLSGVLLNCALYAIIRFHLLTQAAIGSEFSSHLLLGFGVLSMIIAVPFIILQTDIKRMLAYSSIEHVGIITIGLALSTPLSLLGAVFHMVNHGLAKSSMFFLSGTITQMYHSKMIGRITGLLKRFPSHALLFIAGILALAGAPPFSIFLSELTLITAAFQTEVWVGITLILPILFIFAGLTYHTGKMILGEPYCYKQNGICLSQPPTVLEFVIPLIPLVVLFITGFFMPTEYEKILLSVSAILGGNN